MNSQAYVRTSWSTAWASGPVPRSDVCSGATRRAATTELGAGALDDCGGLAVGHEVPPLAARRLQLERDGSCELPSISGERVWQRAPREAGDVLEPIGRCLHDAERFRHVAGADPPFSKACRGERPRRQLTCDPLDPSMGIGCGKRVAEGGRAGSPPRQQRLVRQPAFTRHHRGRYDVRDTPTLTSRRSLPARLVQRVEQ